MEYAHYFTRFNNLSFLHLTLSTGNPSKPKHLSEIDFRMQTENSVRSIAVTVPSLDFFGMAWQTLCHHEVLWQCGWCGGQGNPEVV
jgi:hypothetical protein